MNRKNVFTTASIFFLCVPAHIASINNDTIDRQMAEELVDEMSSEYDSATLIRNRDELERRKNNFKNMARNAFAHQVAVNMITNRISTLRENKDTLQPCKQTFISGNLKTLHLEKIPQDIPDETINAIIKHVIAEFVNIVGFDGCAHLVALQREHLIRGVLESAPAKYVSTTREEISRIQLDREREFLPNLLAMIQNNQER